MKIQSKNVALVLSGGGARGMAHIGVIEEILKNGYTITSIAGTSIGAMIGGVYVSGKLPEFSDWITSLHRLDVVRLLDFAIGKNGFIKGEKVFKEMKTFLNDVDIRELEIPYAAVATDIKNHCEFPFISGNLVKAIRASIAIPTVMRPLYYKGLELVDGGVLNPLPLKYIGRNDGDFVIAVDLNADIPFKRPAPVPQIENHHTSYLKAKEYMNQKWSKFFDNGEVKRMGFFDLITQSIFAMQIRLTQTAIETYKPDVVVSISKDACDLFEFHRATELIEFGRKQCRASLSN